MIEAINLTKRFENKIALDSVNFEIKEGSVYGLVGSNGSGKSTLMRLISGVYTSDGGDILIDGEKPFNNPQLKSKICYLPDTPYFIHQSNINEMAKYYAMLYPTFDWERFEYLSSIFPLNKKARIATMSKGMQRQAALMLCLSVRPKYLLLDEAFDGLDPVMRKVLKSLLAEGVSDGMTAIIASHNLSDLESLCDSVGLLHNGNIVFNEDIDNLKGNVHKVQAVFSMIPDLSVFDELKPMKIEKTGSLIQLVVKGD
ncbi:MAG: ABC transporter ATP-binding protein, partial [Clostridia bacterium]|nr:ABC transporter ATP-binding protein [Clostridia bacterium]